MAIDRPKAIDDAPACGPQRSEGCQPGEFLASRGMGVAQGKKVARRHCGIDDRGEADLRPDQAIGEAVWAARDRRTARGRTGEHCHFGHEAASFRRDVPCRQPPIRQPPECGPDSSPGISRVDRSADVADGSALYSRPRLFVRRQARAVVTAHVPGQCRRWTCAVFPRWPGGLPNGDRVSRCSRRQPDRATESPSASMQLPRR